MAIPSLSKKYQILLIFMCSLSFFSVAQTTISSMPTFSANNGTGMCTFNFQNTNAFPVTITGASSIVARNTASNFYLLYKTTPISGAPGILNAANGWIQAHTNVITSVIGGAANTIAEPVIIGSNLVIPANTTYGIAIGGWDVTSNANGFGAMRYMTIPAANLPTTTFSGGGCNLISGTNISYATTTETSAATFTPRGFVGSITFTSAAGYTCSTATFPTIVDIASNVDTICSGGSANFTLNTTMPAATGIFYQWQSAPAPTGPWTNLGSAQTTPNYTATGISATAWYKMKVLCGTTPQRTSDSVQVVVRPTPVPSATITASPSATICSGTPVSFSATITNGGNAPGYQWKLNGNPVGTNSPNYSNSNLVQGDQVLLTLTSVALCANPATVNSNTITITVTNTLTPDVTITSNPIQNTICGGTPVTFTATPVNGGATPSYQWRINGVNTGTNANTFTTNTINNADIISVVLTTSIPCYSRQKDTSNGITFFVTPSVTPDISISVDGPNNEVCKNAVAHFSAIISNPGLNPSLQWKVNGLTTGASNLDYYTSSLNNGDIVTCELTSDAICRTKSKDTSNTISVIVNNGPAPIITKTGNVLSTGIFAAYQWGKDGANIAGATSQSLTVSSPGNYWVTVTDNKGCMAQSEVLWVPYILGVNDVANAASIKVYPNPASDKVYIEAKIPVQVKVYNSIGQSIWQAKDVKEVAVGQWSDGAYLFEIADLKGTVLSRTRLVKTGY